MSASRKLAIDRVETAGLNELRPLWETLLRQHAEVWTVLPQRAAGDTWERRRRQYEGWLAGQGSFCLVARRGDEAIGYILVEIHEGDETYATGERVAEIQTLVVAGGERSAGIGGRLFDAAMQELQRQDVDDVLVAHMDGNEGARRFYERRGFVPFVHTLYAKRAAPRAHGQGT